MSVTGVAPLILSAVVPVVAVGSQPACDFPRYGWTRTVGHPGYFGEVTRAVAIDPEGNVVLVGHYVGTPGDIVDFDPTQGVDEHPCRGQQDIFITKLGPDGSYRWTGTIGGRGAEEARGVAVDRDGGIVITGWWDGQGMKPLTYVVDFDPTKGVDLHINIAGDPQRRTSSSPSSSLTAPTDGPTPSEGYTLSGGARMQDTTSAPTVAETCLLPVSSLASSTLTRERGSMSTFPGYAVSS